MGHQLGVLAAAELPQAAGLLARAFRDNPLNRAVIGESEIRRLLCNEVGMQVHLPVAAARADILAARSEGRLAGLLVSVPSAVLPLPAPPLRSQLRLLWGQGLRAASRWARVSQALAENHWLGPHCYLATLGVEPALWGQGVGSLLLRAWLSKVDAEDARAYLETDAASNVRFYKRAGFAVWRELPLLGVPITLMERPPARSSRARGPVST